MLVCCFNIKYVHTTRHSVQTKFSCNFLITSNRCWHGFQICRTLVTVLTYLHVLYPGKDGLQHCIYVGIYHTLHGQDTIFRADYIPALHLGCVLSACTAELVGLDARNSTRSSPSANGLMYKAESSQPAPRWPGYFLAIAAAHLPQNTKRRCPWINKYYQGL